MRIADKEKRVPWHLHLTAAETRGRLPAGAVIALALSGIVLILVDRYDLLSRSASGQ
ncbi:MAG TPA: hypothetical protein VJ064_05745 [Limnochordia bacterium]|nr:hypothetical protein [Bacillota bacterium]HKM17705.1 hypothetical protein [Limnochordia bacterium]